MDIDYYFMCNSLPYRRHIDCCDRRFENYHNDEVWVCRHSYRHIAPESSNKFKDLEWNSEPIPVRLVRTNDERPDFYIQRYGECLFIATSKTRYWTSVPTTNWFKKLFHKYEWGERYMVVHNDMISNKLFPEVTELSGIVGVNMERINTE